MAKEHLEEPYTRIINKIGDWFCENRISGQEHQIFWAIIKKTWRWHKKTEIISYTEFAKMTGINRRKCQALIEALVKKRIVLRRKTKDENEKPFVIYGIQKKCHKWGVSPKKATIAQKGYRGVAQKGYNSVPIKATPTIKETLKENIKKENTAAPVEKKKIDTKKIEISKADRDLVYDAIGRLCRIKERDRQRPLAWKWIHKYGVGYLMWCLVRLHRRKLAHDQSALLKPLPYLISMLKRNDRTAEAFAGGDDLVFKDHYTIRQWYDMIFPGKIPKPQKAVRGGDWKPVDFTAIVEELRQAGGKE